MRLPQQTLKQEVPTHWNSIIIIFESVLNNREAIVSTLALMNTSLILYNKDFDILTQMCKILKPFLQITEEVSSEKQVTVSKLILFSRCLRKYFEKFEQNQMSNEIEKVIKK